MTSDHLCIKRATAECIVPSQYSSGNHPICSSDYTPCANMPGGTNTACQDASGVWATKKCAKKLRKGKCHKKRVRKSCKATCNLC